MTDSNLLGALEFWLVWHKNQSAGEHLEGIYPLSFVAINATQQKMLKEEDY